MDNNVSGFAAPAPHTQQHAASSAARLFSRPNVASSQSSRLFSLRDNERSVSDLRRLARKIIVREVIGYGGGGDGKCVVLANAWGVSDRYVERLLSLASSDAITNARLFDLPEPQRSRALAMIAMLPTTTGELAEYVASKRVLKIARAA